MAIAPTDNNATDEQITVLGDGEAIVLRDLLETDPEVVAVVAGADDPEAAVHSCLQVGARAIKLAQVSMDTQVVESAFQGLRGDFDAKLEETLRAVDDATAELLGEEDGALPRALGDFREQFESFLGDAFDADSKRSIIGKFDEMLHELRDEEREAITDLLDPGNDKSPLHRLHRDLSKSFRDEGEATRKLVGELSEKIAVSEAQAEALEKSSLKGRSFEDALHEVLAPLVAPLGDVAEQTGDTTGCAGSKKGDEVVTLNPEDTRGADACYVLEAKDSKLGVKAINEELDGALANRGALAAIAVFGREGQCPTGVPFSYQGNKAIVVLDKDELDTGALQVAALWARWVVRRQLCEDEAEFDVDAIEVLVGDAARALKRHATIKRCHSTAQKKIAEAAGEVEGLVSEVDEALERLRAELAA
jgi:hypothetical protein